MVMVMVMVITCSWRETVWRGRPSVEQTCPLSVNWENFVTNSGQFWWEEGPGVDILSQSWVNFDGKGSPGWKWWFFLGLSWLVTCSVVRVSSWSLLAEIFLSKVFMLGLSGGQPWDTVFNDDDDDDNNDDYDDDEYEDFFAKVFMLGFWGGQPVRHWHIVILILSYGVWYWYCHICIVILVLVFSYR